MARKDASPASSPARGLSDIIGIVLLVLALLLLVALFSFERNDVATNRVPPNESPHNLIGPMGAYMAYGMFLAFGAGAFVVPVLMVGFGLAYLFQFWAYLRDRWLWGAALLFSTLGLFGIFSHLPWLKVIQENMNAPNAGGVIGLFARQYIGGFCGKFGATVILLTLYVISLLFLTNFNLGAWLREWWISRPGSASPEERALEKKARELEKQARRLQESTEKGDKTATAKADKSDKIDKIVPAKGVTAAGSAAAAAVNAAVVAAEEGEKPSLGADLKPLPEPMVRDMSMPKVRKPVIPAAPPALMEVGAVISAREIAAATTDEVLGLPKPMMGNEKPLEKVMAVKGEKPVDDLSAAEGNAAPEGEDEDSPFMPLPKAKLPPGKAKPKPISVAATPKIGNYQLPQISFLQEADESIKPSETKEELMYNARVMQSTLAQFDIEVALGDITKGPTITRYELHPAPGVRLEKIAALNNNIAAALKAERINILVPVPGKSSVGVEVPNLVKTKVIMRELLESEEWINSKARIPLALGKDVYGNPIIADLAEMPHLLIAGSTGSGKSVCINSIIASLLYKFSPEELRFVMIDPKVVELQQYNALPHLVVPVVNDPKKVILALRWVVNEMEKRYQIFAKVGVRNVKSFNERPKTKPVPPPEAESKDKLEANEDGIAVEVDDEIVVPRDDDMVIPDKLSYIVVIIDELADLMLVAPADVEMAIARITQMARAAGIHCIVATQRPSVDVITGVIKANIPARIAFQVAAKVDSRTILDAMGADKLLGKGDMLYLPPGSGRLNRAQGVLITDQEITNVVDFIAKQAKPSYEVEIHKQLQKATPSSDSSGGGGGGSGEEDEDLIQQCIEVIRSEQKASVSLMQRRLRLGYTRAARIMDELEDRGIVGPSKGAEPRDILIDLDGGGADGAGQ